IMVDVGAQNATYAVPIGYARKIAADIVKYGNGQHAWLGIKGVDFSGQTATDMGLAGAVRIQNVLTDSPAHIAGLQKGDIVVAVDSEPVTSMTELILELRRHPPGDSVDVSLLRGGSQLQKVVELQTRAVSNAT
ncbi:MAG: S1C family serine protease, partial [Acidimicrobiales bacterium]